MRPRVFVTRAIPASLAPLTDACDVEVWTDPLPPSRAQLLEHLRGCQGLLCLLTDRVDEALLAACPDLRAVSNMAAGVDNVDLVACTRRGIPVGHTPGVLTEATADMAFALLLSAARRLPDADAFVRSGAWKTWSPTLLLGLELNGATLGIAGMGAIGQAVAARARGFGMHVLYTARAPRAVPHGDWVDKRTLLHASDVLSLHLSLNDETRHWLDAEALAQMKADSILVNTARGGLVDEAALVEALRRGRPAVAALDVMEHEPLPPDSPLLRLPNVLLAPHLGSATAKTRGAMAARAVENLAAALAGTPMAACANARELEAARR